MSQGRGSLRARLADFEARASDAPGDVLRHVQREWRYIPVHPFADDDLLLKRIGWEAGRCLSVDAYWECEEDVYFVQVEAEGQSKRTRGLYYRLTDRDGFNLLAVVDGRPIVRETFESALTRLAVHLQNLGTSEQLSALPVR
jgi:hypothetical protein